MTNIADGVPSISIFHDFMFRACFSRTTGSDCFSLLLTARKSNALSVTAPSQSACHFTKSTSFAFPTMFYSTIFFPNTSILSVRSTIQTNGTICTVRNFLIFAKIYSTNCFVVEIKKHKTDFFLYIFIITVYYCWCYLKSADMLVFT